MHHNTCGTRFRGWISLSNLKFIFPRREVDRKWFERELCNQDISRARISIVLAIDLIFIPFEFRQSFLVPHFLRNARNLCKLSHAVDQAHENRSVDSAFHKERLSRCVDDITFLPTGPRYIVNIRAGGAHFSDEILRKNRHFDVIRVCNSTYYYRQQRRYAIRGIDITRVYILCKNSSYKKIYLYITFRTFPYLCTT